MGIRTLKSNKLKEVIEKICPIYTEFNFQKEKIAVSKDESGTGWFIKCRLCQEAICTAYLEDN